MNFSKNEETDYWLEVENLYDRSNLDRSILVKSFGKEKLLKHFYHCTEQGRTSELCVHVINKVTHEKRTQVFQKLKMSPGLSIRNSEVEQMKLCSDMYFKSPHVLGFISSTFKIFFDKQYCCIAFKRNMEIQNIFTQKFFK